MRQSYRLPHFMHEQAEAYSHDLIINQWQWYLNLSKIEFLTTPVPLIMAEEEQ